MCDLVFFCFFDVCHVLGVVSVMCVICVIRGEEKEKEIVYMECV